MTKQAGGIAQDAKRFLFQLWRLEPGHRKMVPLPTPSSLMRSDLNTLETKPYMLAVKHDGVRAILLFGHLPMSGERYVVFLQRNGRCDITTSITCPTSSAIFSGTVFDGERMDDGTYHVFDAVTVRGFSCSCLSLDKRLELATEALTEINGPVSVKSFIPGKDAGAFLTDFAARPDNDVDGIILAPLHDPIGVGRLVKYFKYKTPEHITVDLKWNTDSKLLLCGPPGNEQVEEALRGIHWHEGDFAMYDDGILECSFGKSDEERDEYNEMLTIKPKMRRDDKETANSQFVVRRTVQNLIENITVPEIARALGCQLQETNHPTSVSPCPL